MQIAKNKLRLTKVCHLFQRGGEDFKISAVSSESTDVYVSCGEPYQGPSVQPSVDVKMIGCKSETDISAKEQLMQVARLPGVVMAFGMPDLHAGPTGCTVLSRGCLYPHLAGSDIGCGIALFNLGKHDHEKLVTSVLNHVRTKKQMELAEIKHILNQEALLDDDHLLGTIGAGNHFAEMMLVDEVFDASAMEDMRLGAQDVLLCVHSGSRHLGRAIFAEFGPQSIQSEHSRVYLNKHDHAMKWARLNRQAIASRIISVSDLQLILDITHNSIQYIPSEDVYIHRKGAAPTDQGPVVIPGSRGTASYLVKPKDEQTSLWASGRSVAHGAGRRLTRSKAYAKSVKRYGNNPDKLRKTDIGSFVHCSNFKLMAEEIPEAYKDIHVIIEDLLPYVDLVARLKPILTIKDL